MMKKLTAVAFAAALTAAPLGCAFAAGAGVVSGGMTMPAGSASARDMRETGAIAPRGMDSTAGRAAMNTGTRSAAVAMRGSGRATGTGRPQPAQRQPG
jgi:hypothetical protein